MAETVDYLSIDYFDQGVQTVKQLDKIVLSKGAWSTIETLEIFLQIKRS